MSKAFRELGLENTSERYALEALGHNRMQLGVAIGCVGIAMVVSNYFFYKAMRKAGKAKYGERIPALSDELLHENEKN